MTERSAATVLLRRLMRAFCARPKLRKLIEEVRDGLRTDIALATVPRLHAPPPRAEEIEALTAAFALAEAALSEADERMAG